MCEPEHNSHRKKCKGLARVGEDKTLYHCVQRRSSWLWVGLDLYKFFWKFQELLPHKDKLNILHSGQQREMSWRSEQDLSGEKEEKRQKG